MKLRNSLGQFRKKRTYIIFILLAIAILIFPYGKTEEIQLVQADTRDNPQKMTDNLAEKIRLEDEAKKTLVKAEKIYLEAKELHNTAYGELEGAIEAVNFFIETK